MVGLLLLIAAWTVAPRDERVVHVVDAAKQPVAGAWVAAFGDSYDETELDRDALQNWIERGGEGPPDSRTHWHRTDASGVARLRDRFFWNDVVAVTPSLGGHAIVVRGSAKEVDVALRPHRFWRVQVVDPADPKAKPRVAVEFGRARSGGSQAAVECFARRETAGEESIATFGPLDLALDPEEIDPLLVAKLDLLAFVPPRLRCRASAIGGEPMRLELPPHGRIEIRVIGADGMLASDDFDVSVRLDEFHQLDLAGPYFFNDRLLTCSHGIASIDAVGLGADLHVELVDPPSPGSKHTMKTTLVDASGVVSGLTFPGQTSVVTLAATGAPPHDLLVEGRAVDPGGNAVAHAQLGVNLHEVASGACLAHSRERVETDASGRFHAILKLADELPALALLVVAEFGPVPSSNGQARAAATVAVSKLTWSGGSLGDVVLQPLPILLAGRAIDERGEPIEDLRIGLDCAQDSLAADTSIPAWWRDEFDRGVSVDTGPDGRFELRGHRGRQTWEMKSWGPDFMNSDGTPVVPGTSDLVVRRERGVDSLDGEATGGIAGMLLLDPEVPRKAVTVELVRPRELADPPPPRWGDSSVVMRRLDEVGFGRNLGDRFGDNGASVGTWDLHVTFGDLGQPDVELVRLKEVKIERNATTVVPPIDLRGRIQVARAELVDRDGDPVPSGHVFCRERLRTPRGPRERSADEQPDYARFSDGEFVACSLDSWPAFELLGHGCRRVALRFDRPGDRRVVLPPELVVRVHLPEGVALPPQPLTLDVSLTTEQILAGVMFIHGGAPPNGATGSFDATRVVELRLPAAATYSMSVGVFHRTSGRDAGGSWFSSNGRNVLSSIPIRLEDRDEPRDVDLAITPEMVTDAIKALGY